MARPTRNDVDYFPFMCKEGKGMYVIEEKYGNDGFATWIKILRSLATTNFHYLNLSDPSEKMFLSAKCKISQSVLESIIDDLINLGEFDKELWDEFSILYSEKFIESIEDAYKKRNNSPLTKDQLLEHLSSLGLSKPSKSIPKPSFDTLKGGNNSQSKVEYSIVEEKKENNITGRTLSSFGNWKQTISSDEVLVRNLFQELLGKYTFLDLQTLHRELNQKLINYEFYYNKYKFKLNDEKHLKNSFKKFAIQFWNKNTTQIMNMK